MELWLDGYNHRWLHSLPPGEKNKINDAIIEFKAAVLHPSSKGLEVDASTNIEIDFSNIKDEDCLIIPVQTYDKRKKKSFNRAKEKREFYKQVDEELYGQEEDDKNDDLQI